MAPFDYRPFYKSLHEHEWFQTTKYFHGKCAQNWKRPKIIHDFFFQTTVIVNTPVLFAWLDVSRFFIQSVKWPKKIADLKIWQKSNLNEKKIVYIKEKIISDLCCQVSNHLKVAMPSRKWTFYEQKKVNGNDIGSRVYFLYSVVKVSRNTCYTFF